MPKSSGGSVDPPAPGASQAVTVNWSDSPSSWLLHVERASPTKPWTRTTSGPAPMRSKAILSPPTSTYTTSC
ncbi:hypothetical protein ABN611_30025 [Kribbella sp. HUAS MG21]|uniref:Uncharacterized protein n=1 Tax=Kribbella sp. HUAS MG21 TaxID=3160966 RepID=A0AAU7T7Z7_9ACTN